MHFNRYLINGATSTQSIQLQAGQQSGDFTSITPSPQESAWVDAICALRRQEPRSQPNSPTQLQPRPQPQPVWLRCAIRRMEDITSEWIAPGLNDEDRSLSTAAAGAGLFWCRKFYNWNINALAKRRQQLSSTTKTTLANRKCLLENIASSKILFPCQIAGNTPTSANGI